MRTWTIFPLLLSFIVAVSSPFQTYAQTPPGKEQDVDRIVVGTREVVLDAVVKDRKGRPVKELAGSDFEVFEDGVPQQVKSFRLVTRDAGPLVAPKGEGSAKTNPGVNESEA